jgi:hypothetical protein
MVFLELLQVQYQLKIHRHHRHQHIDYHHRRHQQLQDNLLKLDLRLGQPQFVIVQPDKHNRQV